MWRPLLFLLLSLSPCRGFDETIETCLTGSDRICQLEEDLSKLCENLNETNSDIFRCDLEESSPEDGRKEEFTVGKTIKLEAQGDFHGYGCSFEITNAENGVTCCYIKQSREGQRNESSEELKLCNAEKQPEECRQPGSGEYEVKEIPGPVRWCRLTLFRARIADSGDYKIRFPKEPAKDMERTVNVKLDGSTQWKPLAIGGGVAVAGVIILSLPILWALKERSKREFKEREEDEAIFKEIKRENEGEYKKRLGNRSIFGLRDKNYNNIYHFASYYDWMADIVSSEDKRFRKVGTTDEEAATTTTPSSSGIQKITSRMYRWWLDVIPYYFWPSDLPHPTLLDSKNIRGDTPLMIAAELGRKDLVQIMLDNDADVNKKNNRGQTALYKTIANYTQETKDARHEIVQLLLKKGATVTGHFESHTLLHTAVQKNSLEIVKLLAFPEAKEKLLLLGERSRDDEAETAFQLSVRLGFEDIAEFLIDQDAKTKEPWNQEIVKTVYPAVQAGHVKILTTLMEKGNLICNDSRRALLRKAVEENNQSALGFLFSKYYNPIAHSTRPVLPASEDELDQDRISDIAKALADAIDKKQNETFTDKIKTADYLVGWLSEAETENKRMRRQRSVMPYEDSRNASVKKEALALANEMKEDFIKHGRVRDSDTAQYIIVELSMENDTVRSSDALLRDARSPWDSDEKKRALSLVKEKKKELEKGLKSLKWIIEKLSEEEKTARALSIAKEKKKKDSPKDGNKEACQFVIDWLSFEYQPDGKDKQPKSDPRMIEPVKDLFKKWQSEFKDEKANLEAIEHAITKLEKKKEKEKEWFAVDETAHQSLDPLSREANENELGNPDDEKRAREAQKEKRKQTQELAQKIRDLTKQYTGKNSNKELIVGIGKFIDDLKDLQRELPSDQSF